MTVTTEHCHWGLEREKPDSDKGKTKTGSTALLAFPLAVPHPRLRFPLFIDSIHCECPHGVTWTGGTMTVVMSHLKTCL